MDILPVTLFGDIRIIMQNWNSEIKIPREVQLLLAHLLTHRRRAQPLEVVAGMFWERLARKRRVGLFTGRYGD